MVTATRPIYGAATKASGVDPNKSYDMRYRVVSLSDLRPSHDTFMNTNPDYPSELQPRLRDRDASRKQVVRIAANLNTDAMLTDVNALDRGPMIVGSDLAVESGNGRIIALLMASQQFPEQFAKYRDALRGRVADYGIDPASISAIDDPVLVRERTSEVDRVRFAGEANQSAMLTMSPVELARQDAGRISNKAASALEIGDNETIEEALRKAKNADVVDSFLKNMPDTERAALADAQGRLNILGIQRIKAALFYKTYGGDAGLRLAQTFFESAEPTIKNIESALFDSLGKSVAIKAMIEAGDRAEDLDISDDVAAAVDTYARLKSQGISVADFLGQQSMFGSDLTANQERLLVFIDQFSRSRKGIREFLIEYAEKVRAQPVPNQSAMFNDATIPKEEIVDGIIKRKTENVSVARPGRPDLFAALEDRERREFVQEAAIAPDPVVSPQLAGPAIGRRDAPEVAVGLIPPPIQIGQVQAGMGIGETPPQAELLGETQGRATKPPPIGEDFLRRKMAEKARGEEIAKGQAEMVAPMPVAVAEAPPEFVDYGKRVLVKTMVAKGVLEDRPAFITRTLVDTEGKVVYEVQPEGFDSSIRVPSTDVKREPPPDQKSSKRVAPKKPIPVAPPKREPEKVAASMPPKTTDGDLLPITVEQAKRRFAETAKNPAVDVGRQAKRVAPANPQTPKDIRAQHSWYRRPNQSDFEGVDRVAPTEKPKTPKDTQMTTQGMTQAQVERARELKRLDIMGEIIAISSPSGRTSKRVMDGARKRIEAMQNDPIFLPTPEERAKADFAKRKTTLQNTINRLRKNATDWDHYASGGMKPRVYRKQAIEARARAAQMEAELRAIDTPSTMIMPPAVVAPTQLSQGIVRNYAGLRDWEVAELAKRGNEAAITEMKRRGLKQEAPSPDRGEYWSRVKVPRQRVRK